MYKCKNCGWSGEPYKQKSGREVCRECSRKRSAEWYKNNSEGHRKARAEYYRSNKDVIAIRAKGYRGRNVEKIRATKRAAWMAMTPGQREEHNRKQKIYRKKAGQARRGSERRAWALSGDVTREELNGIIKRDGGCCVYCGTEVSKFACHPSNPVGFDHITPKSRGGKNTASNMVVCCFSCNCTKYTGTVERLLEVLKNDVGVA